MKKEPKSRRDSCEWYQSDSETNQNLRFEDRYIFSKKNSENPVNLAQIRLKQNWKKYGTI